MLTASNIRASLIVLMMEIIRTSETSLNFYQNTRRKYPKIQSSSDRCVDLSTNDRLILMLFNNAVSTARLYGTLLNEMVMKG
jgi:hypothetical protein